MKITSISTDVSLATGTHSSAYFKLDSEGKFSFGSASVRIGNDNTELREEIVRLINEDNVFALRDLFYSIR